MKVLSKEPSARYRTADQLGRLLLGLYDSNPDHSMTMAFVRDTFQRVRGDQSQEQGADLSSATPPPQNYEVSTSTATFYDSAKYGTVSDPQENVQTAPSVESVEPEPVAAKLRQLVGNPRLKSFMPKAQGHSPFRKSEPANPVLQYTQDWVEEESEAIDWKTWLLGLAAAAMLIGLIPFWLFVYMQIKP